MTFHDRRNHEYTTYIHMQRNVILTNKRCTHTQSNYTNTKLKAWFRRLLHHPARKQRQLMGQTDRQTYICVCICI